MDLTVVDFNNSRVLTTGQLSEVYGATAKKISQNFIRNIARYKEGKHFFQLTGDAKRDFLNHLQFEDSSKNSAVMYLWTEKGAWLHAKSLNTDEAWDAYERLVDDYYVVKQSDMQTSQLSPELQMFKKLWDGMAKKEIEDQRRDEEIKGLNTTITAIKDTILMDSDDWRKSINSMLNQATSRSDGDYQQTRRMSYKKLESRGRCDLSVRLDNLKSRLKKSGANATRVRAATKLEVIESDARLKEIYTTIVKELSIGSLV